MLCLGQDSNGTGRASGIHIWPLKGHCHGFVRRGVLLPGARKVKQKYTLFLREKKVKSIVYFKQVTTGCTDGGGQGRFDEDFWACSGETK